MICVGSHVSVAGGLEKGVQRAVDVGCDCIQIFTKNNNQWAAKPLTDAAIEAWKTALAESTLTHPIAHSSYLINMATPKDDLFQKSVDALVVELERGNTAHALELIDQALEIADSDELQLNRARILARAGQGEEARQLLGELLARGESPVQAAARDLYESLR